MYRLSFLLLHENIWYSLESPKQGISNEYPLHIFSWRNKKNVFCGCSSYLDVITKLTYSNILKILQPKTKKENFQIKHSDILHISAQNIDFVYSLELPQQGSPNEYPQSMFLSRNKKNNVYPCKPQFYCIKVGFKGLWWLVIDHDIWARFSVSHMS